MAKKQITIAQQEPQERKVLTKAELSKIRVKAEYLVFKQHMTQKEAAKVLGISENAMCIWAKKYKWKEKYDKRESDRLKNPTKFDDSLSAFVAYVRVNRPELWKSVNATYYNFLKTV